MGITTFVKRAALSLQALALLVGFSGGTIVTAVALSAPAYADCANTDPSQSANPIADGTNCSKANGTSSNLFGQNGVFKTAANTLVFLVGAVSVIFLIIGGLRYVISQGDPKAVGQAKDTILYAVIGIVVAVVSFAVVNWVVTALNSTSTG